MSRTLSVGIWGMLAAWIAGSPLLFSQTGAQTSGGKTSLAAASRDIPHRDISGTWTPDVEDGGIGGRGPYSMPSDGKHEPPYTALAREKMKAYRPGNGIYQNIPSMINDPAVIYCDPEGVPRIDLYELRATQIVQQKRKVFILHQYEKIWRSIWTDGRQLPTDPEPLWFGYSVGKWEDDYTFVAQTNGVDERTWLDKTGRPHSDAMRVEESFHRISKDLLEFTVTIDDPKMYMATWKPLNKFRMKLLPEDYEPTEMMCSVSEYMQYNKQMGFGNPTGGSRRR